MIKKTIKGSKRGLYFTFGTSALKIGDHFKYVVAPKASKIFIVKSETGNTISKRKTTRGTNKKLIDMRSRQVVDLTSRADKLTIISNEHSITVVASKDDKPLYNAKVSKGDAIKMVSLFSGCGMLDYPFHLDDSFNIVFATDYEKDMCESYKQNIGDHVHNRYKKI